MLKFIAHYTAEQRAQRVAEVIDEMHLNDVLGRRVGNALERGLSTGERKRLNIALELIPVASVFFMVSQRVPGNMFSYPSDIVHRRTNQQLV